MGDTNKSSSQSFKEQFEKDKKDEEDRKESYNKYYLERRDRRLFEIFDNHMSRFYEQILLGKNKFVINFTKFNSEEFGAFYSTYKWKTTTDDYLRMFDKANSLSGKEDDKCFKCEMFKNGMGFTITYIKDTSESCPKFHEILEERRRWKIEAEKNKIIQRQKDVKSVTVELIKRSRKEAFCAKDKSDKTFVLDNICTDERGYNIKCDSNDYDYFLKILNETIGEVAVCTTQTSWLNRLLNKEPTFRCVLVD